MTDFSVDRSAQGEEKPTHYVHALLFSCMKIPPLLGLGGIILAVFMVDLNDSVVTIALADVSGGLGISRDTATWITTLYVTGEVCGMATSPTLSLIFTLRRFALFVMALAIVPSVLMPFSPGSGTLLALRAIQGLAGGFVIPMLLTTALRVLDPQIRLWGLAAYAVSATIAPNLATTFAALWVDGLRDWRFVFFGTVPFAAGAATLIWFGMDQDEPKAEMLRRFDWPGALLVAIGFGGLSILLEQGDRLDWFNSDVITILALTSALAIPLLVWRELTAPQPLFKLQLLLRPNFAYSALALIMLLVIASGASSVPIRYLEVVHGYRPLQANTLTLWVALSQLLFLPLTVLLLDHRSVDARWVSACGYLCILAGLVGGTTMNATWLRQQFIIWQLVQSLGFALVVVPVLLFATNSVTPQEGPYASGMVNTPRAISQALGVWLAELIERWRGGFHRDHIVDTLGNRRFEAVQALPLGRHLPALTPQGMPRAPGALQALEAQVMQQVTTLTTIDTFIVLSGLVVFMLVVLALLPTRTFPPRIQLAEG